MKQFRVIEIPDGDYDTDKIKAFSINGLDGDYFMERTKLDCTILKDSVAIYNIKYNANSILLGKGKNKGYFEVYNYADVQIGFIDEIPSMKKVFAIQLSEDVYSCVQVTSSIYLVYQNNNLIARIERDNVEGIIEYEVNTFEDNSINVLALVTLYIDRKWFEDDKLESAPDKGLGKLVYIPKFPNIEAFRCKLIINSFRKNKQKGSC